MEGLKQKIDLREIGATIELFHYKNFTDSNKDHIKNLRTNCDKYIFCFNLKNEIDILLPKENTYNLQKFDMFMSYGAINSLQIKLSQSMDNEFIIILMDAPTLKNVIGNCESTDYSLFIKSKKLRHVQETYLSVVDNLLKIGQKGKASLSSMELISRIYMLLNACIRQYVQTVFSITKKTSILKIWEKSEIEKITTKIRTQPDANYTLQEISEQSGISIPRLQQGFKEMHNTTVGQFIRDTRLSKAEMLLRKTESNITEIVYRVGLTNRSYFSKIFKQKYNYTPSEYKKIFKNSYS